MLISTSQAAPTLQGYIYVMAMLKKSVRRLLSAESESASRLQKIWHCVAGMERNMIYPHPSSKMAPVSNRKSGVKTVEKTALIKIKNLVTPKIENLVTKRSIKNGLRKIGKSGLRNR